MRIQKTLSLAVVLAIFISITPIALPITKADDSAETWLGNDAYKRFYDMKTLDDALMFLSIPLNAAELLGAEIVENQEGELKGLDLPVGTERDENMYYGYYELDEPEGWIIRGGKEMNKFKIENVNPSHRVPEWAVRKRLEQLDVSGEHCTLEKMLAEVGKLGNSYWDCLSKEVTGEDLEGLKARLEEIYSDPTTYLTPLGPAAGWVEQDIKEILEDMEDGTLSPKSGKKLRKVLLEITPKLAKIAKVGGPWGIIIATVAGPFVDAAISKKEYKAQFGRLKAIDKWAHIDLGLEGYKAIEGFFTQEKWGSVIMIH